jgi:hypothetical protein
MAELESVRQAIAGEFVPRADIRETDYREGSRRGQDP